MNKFIEAVKQENKDLDKLENQIANKEIAEDVAQVKREQLEYKNRYALYLSLNNGKTISGISE